MLVAACASTNSALAGAAHVHGKAVVQLAIDASMVTIDMSVPAHDVLGFEHAPESAMQRTRVATARTQLARPWYRVPSVAACRLTTASVRMPADASGQHASHGHDGPGTTPHRHAGAHDEAHDHGRAGTSDEAEHGDVHVRHVLTCRATERLAAMDIHLFDAFNTITEVQVQFATPRRQGEQRTTARDRRVRLDGE